MAMRTMILGPDWDFVLWWCEADCQDAIDEKTLPISDDLKRDLDRFYGWFSELYFGDGDSKSVLELRLLDARGFELWLRLREELKGVHRVLFYSQEFYEAFENPEDYKAAKALVGGEK